MKKYIVTINFNSEIISGILNFIVDATDKQNARDLGIDSFTALTALVDVRDGRVTEITECV